MKIIIDFMGTHTELTGGFAFAFCAVLGVVIFGFVSVLVELFK